MLRVSMPQTLRSVSATRAAGSSAGWQHMKMSPSSSAARGSAAATRSPSASGAPAASLRAAASLPARRPSRRARSSALCLATPTSHARGLPGTPSAGHLTRASAQASCTASSAASRSPVSLAVIATADSQCSRNSPP